MNWNRARNPLLLVAVGMVLFFTNLGATRLWDVDEAIFSEAAREMFDRGDLVVPYFNGELFAHKPPLLYWCQIAAYRLFGPTEFAARCGSALLGIGSMLITYALGRILLGSRAGLWAGLILGSCVNFTIIARAATPDAYLVFFCTLSLLVLVRGTYRPDSRGDATLPWQPALPPSWKTYALAYAVMGVAVLVKGPVGVVLPTAVWGLFLLFEQRFQQSASKRDVALNVRTMSHPRWVRWLGWLPAFHPWYVLRTIWSMRPLTALAAVLLVAGPWYAWVGVRTEGEFLREFFGVHNFGRFANAMENHRGPIWYYAAAIVIGSFPWCILLVPCVGYLVQTIRARTENRSGLVLLASWVAVWVGFFSLAGTKLPSYVVPAYPAVALIFAALIDRWLSAPAASCRAWLRVCWSVAALFGVAILVVVPWATRTYLAGELAPAFVGVVLILGAATGIALAEMGKIRHSLGTMAITSIVFCTWLLGFSLLPIDAHQTSAGFAELIRANTAGPRPHVAAYHYLPPSLVFYMRQPIDGLGNSEAVAAHFREHPRDAFLYTTDEHYGKLVASLPVDVTVLATSRRFLKPSRILLLGREAEDSITPRNGPILVGSRANASRR